MKIIIAIGIIICSGMIGYGFAISYKKRKLFYKELIIFINTLQSNISFSNREIKEIINLNKFSSDVNKILNAYVSYIDFKKDYKKDIDVITYINAEEKSYILTFFNGLGRYNSSTQISELENYKMLFDKYLKDAEEKEKKYFSLNIKMGIIAGALIALLIL